VYDLYPPAISADGRYVAFASAATNLAAGDAAGRVDVFVRDLRDGVTTCVSRTSGGGEANDASIEPSLSLDGRYVAFRSYASDLVAGDSNGATDVFVRDRTAATTIRVDAGWLGLQANGDAYPGTRICGLGFAVAYTSLASDLVLGDPNGKTDVFLNANDPRTAASTAARLYIATLRAWIRAHLPFPLRLRANG
jgi:Tol biopolymer transport system component